MIGFFMSAGSVTPPSDGERALELWWLKSSYPVVMTNSSPWSSHGPTTPDRIMEKKNVSIYRRRLSMIEKLRTFFFP